MTLVGPYTGEFGDEILCWIPYCRSLFGDNFTAISRGKTDSWYPGPVINAYDLLSLDEYTSLLNARVLRTHSHKQHSLDELDQLILDRAGLSTNCHPSVIYKLGRVACPKAPWVKFKPLPRWDGLPARYTAIRFYENDWLGKPRNPFKVPIVRQDIPTVGLRLLTPCDNHGEVDLTCDILVEYEPKDSFEVLSRVISHAEHFICNYGSFPSLALSYGIPTTAYCGGSPRSWHSDLEASLAKATGAKLEVISLDPIYSGRN